MKKQFANLLWSSLLLSLSYTSVVYGITVDFAGTLESTCGHFDSTSGECDGFGLGLSVHDPFTGQWTYDAETAAVNTFFVEFPTFRFDASNLSLMFHPFDGSLTLFGVKGSLPNGLFLTVGLTNGDTVGTGTLPLSFSCANWFLCGLQINETGNIPFEMDWMDFQGISALNAANEETAVFALSTMQHAPEPSTVVLIGLGCLALVWKYHRSNAGQS